MNGAARGGRWASLIVALVAMAPAGCAPAPATRVPKRALRAGTFPDRPVAWDENDREDVAVRPRGNDLQEMRITLLLRDSLANESDRLLAGEEQVPARDVNALDEVPCSTWFCPRNHRRAMSPEALAAGPDDGFPPRLPLRIMRGKDTGATAGFQVEDADGRRFMLKFDVTPHLGMLTGAEVIGTRLFHGAGYNVPGSFVVDLRPEELTIDPEATYKLYGVQKKPVDEAYVRDKLADVARLPDGRLRAVAVNWIEGEVLGAFDMIGQRSDDPNDRIPHQHRRSLRATLLMYAWLGVLDGGTINTLDSYVSAGAGERRFVRHHIIDFGAALGSATTRVKGPHEGQQYIVEVGRTLAAFFALGFYRRPYQNQRREWIAHAAEHPSVGWFPEQPFDPRGFRTNWKVPAHMRLTRRDAYWAAKVVTSFSDGQLAAVVATADLPPDGAAHVERALRARRDAIGRTFLREVTAVENARLSETGNEVCFSDLALARGYASAGEVHYAVEITGLDGSHLLSARVPATGPSTCLPVVGTGLGTGLGAGVGSGAAHPDYRIVQITAEFGGQDRDLRRAVPVRLHLRWRPADERLALVGVERDE